MSARVSPYAPVLIRWLLVAGGAGIVGLWWVIRAVAPELYDPLEPRVAIGSACWLLAGASIGSAWVRRWVYELALVLAGIGTWWAMWLVDQNGFGPEMQLVAMMVVASNIALMGTVTRVALYAVLVAVAIAVNSTSGGSGPVMLGACSLTMTVLVGVSMRDREVLLNRLAAAHDELERRVDERTAQLVAEMRERSAAEHAAMSALRAKDSFLEAMSHELRTPLSTIIGYADLVREDLDGGELDQILADLRPIESAAGLLTGLVDQVLELARLERSSTREFRVCSLPELLRMQVEAVRPLAELDRCDLELAIDPAAGTVFTDPDILEKVIGKLLSNAVRFTGPGRVVLCASKEGGWLRIDVRDTGCGIAPGRLDELFEPFGRKASTSEGGRAGVGLAIAQQGAALLGGHLSVESEEGRGSTFTLRVPDHRAADVAA